MELQFESRETTQSSVRSRSKPSRKDDKSKRTGDGGQPPKQPPDPEGKGSSVPEKKGKASSTGKKKKDKEAKVSKEKIASLLGKYNGKSCLETFLNKFDNCTKYGKWYEVDI